MSRHEVAFTTAAAAGIACAAAAAACAWVILVNPAAVLVATSGDQGGLAAVLAGLVRQAASALIALL
jgi:hypothetical protein